MKRFVSVIALAFALYTAANAQLKVDFGTFAAGATANYGISGDYKNPGVGITVQKFFGDAFRSNVYVNYFFKQNNVSMLEFGTNFNYVFPLTKQMGIYPILGLGYSIVKLKGVIDIPSNVTILPDDYADDSVGAIHFDLGVGYEYYITPSFKAFAEAKYRYAKDYDRSIITAGVAYVW